MGKKQQYLLKVWMKCGGMLPRVGVPSLLYQAQPTSLKYSQSGQSLVCENVHSHLLGSPHNRFCTITSIHTVYLYMYTWDRWSDESSWCRWRESVCRGSWSLSIPTVHRRSRDFRRLALFCTESNAELDYRQTDRQTAQCKMCSVSLSFSLSPFLSQPNTVWMCTYTTRLLYGIKVSTLYQYLNKH